MAYDMSRLRESIETIEEYDLIRLTKDNRWLRRKLNHKTMDYDALARQYTMLVDMTRKLLAVYGEKQERCPVCEEEERTMACIPCIASVRNVSRSATIVVYVVQKLPAL
jgi:hypothetical protein